MSGIWLNLKQYGDENLQSWKTCRHEILLKMALSTKINLSIINVLLGKTDDKYNLFVNIDFL